MTPVRYRVLGPLELRDGDGRLVRLHAPKRRTLLGLLLLYANQPVGTDRLAEALWGPRPPASAAGVLRTYLSWLRRGLGLTGRDGMGQVVAEPGGYRLVVPAGQLDLLVFDRLAAEGEQALAAGDLELAAARLEEAAGLWRGRAFEDVGLDGAAAAELAQLEERRLRAAEGWVEARLALGQHERVLERLAALVVQEPLRERLWAGWMLALYRSGRQAEALAAFGELRGRLVQELGIDPSPPLQELHRQLLSADPALDAPAAAPPGPAPVEVVVPRQLPADVATFTGREGELARLIGALEAEDRPAPVVCALQGAGGIGKSALAVHAAHRLAGRFPDGQLYVDLHGATDGLSPLAPLEVLGRFLRGLGMEPAAVPTDVEEASAAFRSRVAGRRLLVVLDNARDAAQVRPLLPATPGCAVLVTSRRLLASLDGASHLHLDILPAVDAVELLGRLAGRERVAGEPGPAAEVARWCGWLPLALRISGARLAARPGWPVRALAERLADEQRRLDELDLPDVGVRASFAVSHHELVASTDPLDRAAAGAFGLLGVLDGADVGVPVVARLLDQPADESERVLERLVDAQLLETPSPGRYRLHDLLRLYAREQRSRGIRNPTGPRPSPARSACTWRPPGRRWSCCGRATTGWTTPRTAGAREGWGSPTPRRRSSGWRPSGPTCSPPSSRPPPRASPASSPSSSPRACSGTSRSAATGGTWCGSARSPSGPPAGPATGPARRRPTTTWASPTGGARSTRSRWPACARAWPCSGSWATAGARPPASTTSASSWSGRAGWRRRWPACARAWPSSGSWATAAAGPAASTLSASPSGGRGGWRTRWPACRRAWSSTRSWATGYGQADSLQELGSTLRALGRPEEARAHWRRALTLFEQLQSTDAEQVRALLAD